jgi:hypothetical protein
LAIDEQSFGNDHPEVATDLSNLALLLQVTNRLAEAEPLMRRALLIRIAFTRLTGHKHPRLDTSQRKYRELLEALGETPAQIEQRFRELDDSPDSGNSLA